MTVKSLTLVVSGSRHCSLADREFVISKLSHCVRVMGALPSQVRVIHGGAKGVDSVADEWARDRGFHVFCCDALWDHFGKGAGQLRNEAMLRLAKTLAGGVTPDPVSLFAFPRANSIGTRNFIAAAWQQYGLCVNVTELL